MRDMHKKMTVQISFKQKNLTLRCSNDGQLA